MVFQSKGSNTEDIYARGLARYFPRNFAPRSAIQSNEHYIGSDESSFKHYSLFDERDYKLCIGLNKIFRSSIYNILKVIYTKSVNDSYRMSLVFYLAFIGSALMPPLPLAPSKSQGLRTRISLYSLAANFARCTHDCISRRGYTRRLAKILYRVSIRRTIR